MTFYKYNGAGNDFLVADNRDGSIRLTERYISEICDRHYGVGADGVMLLGDGSDRFDFTMDYYNSDGSGGMMCGNGGRCIVAFADFLGLSPAAEDGCWAFAGPDGMHRAYLLRDEKAMEPRENTRTVRLKMRDISVPRHYDSLKADHAASGWFIDTGTRHFVRLLDDPVDEKYVDRQGRNLRWTPEFAPLGVNVNFVIGGNPLEVRTFEKGVEAETCACGTGITASAVAAWLRGIAPASRDLMTGALHYEVDALNDRLSVDFLPHIRPEDILRTVPTAQGCDASAQGASAPSHIPVAHGPAAPAQESAASSHDPDAPLFTDVWLTGPATLVAKIDIL